MMNDSSLAHSRASSFSKLPHSQSTPVGVDGGVVGCSRTPPTTPKKGGKMLAVRVQMLDDSITIFQVQVSIKHIVPQSVLCLLNIFLQSGCHLVLQLKPVPGLQDQLQ